MFSNNGNSVTALLVKYFHHKVILNLTSVSPPSYRQLAALVRQYLTYDWCSTKEDANLDFARRRLLLGAITGRFDLHSSAGTEVKHVIVVLVQNDVKVWPPKVCRIQQARQWRCRMLFSSMELKHPTVYVGAYCFPLCGNMGVHPDIQMSGIRSLVMSVLADVDFVEEVGEP